MFTSALSMGLLYDFFYRSKAVLVCCGVITGLITLQHTESSHASQYHFVR
ncbi:hypothetical protein [Marinibactrum halimedae]|nr:hypothetical protein [Marinibactrum halimedae]MCD9458470.1 hypothetical protein [Marinibactrum halimedae]